MTALYRHADDDHQCFYYFCCEGLLAIGPISDWRKAPFRLSATACLTYSQLQSIFGARIFRQQLEGAPCCDQKGPIYRTEIVE
jgi:hypothetical protein